MEHTVFYKTHDFNTAPEQVDDLLGEGILQTFAMNIDASNYHTVDTDEVEQQQKHLTPEQCNELAKLLQKFPRLFDG